MEIQTFFLAEEITQTGSRHDVRWAGLVIMNFAPETVFPVQFTAPALMILRREDTSGEAAISLRFDIVDEDGRPAGKPNRLRIDGKIPEGHRFLHILATIGFEFPTPGRYRIDITTDDAPEGSVYHYAIDILRKEA